MVNNPTWYISVLLLCYIVFYLLTYLGKRWQIPHTYLFVFMVLLGCGAQTYGLNLPFLNGSSCRGYYAFFFGVLPAEWLEKLNAAKKSQNIYILGKRRFGRIPVMHDGIQMGAGSQRYQLSDDVLVLPGAHHHFQQWAGSKAV